jgi:hypothetical protein
LRIYFATKKMTLSNTNDLSIYKEDSESIESGSPTTNSFGVDEEDPAKDVGNDEAETARTKKFVVIVAIAAALGGLVFGYGAFTNGIVW